MSTGKTTYAAANGHGFEKFLLVDSGREDTIDFRAITVLFTRHHPLGSWSYRHWMERVPRRAYALPVGSFPQPGRPLRRAFFFKITTNPSHSCQGLVARPIAPTTRQIDC
jgi:hypothetical protein